MSPWTHTYLSPQSERRLCCASREPAQSFTQYIDTAAGSGVYAPVSLEEWWNGPHLRQVRRQMMAGNAPPECEVCNHKLLNTDVYRTYFWHLFQHHYDEIWDTTDETGATTMRPVSWDYRFSNLCNFKCRMCGDMLSSSWEAESRRDGSVDMTNPRNAWMMEPVRTQMRRWQEDEASAEFMAGIENNTIEEIYWAGGEPLMFEQHWDAMAEIIRRGRGPFVYARYNTNLSRIEYKGVKLVDILGGLRDWQVCASIDGVGQPGEYIRTGLKYSEWHDNLLAIKKIARHRRQLKLDLTLTMPGMLGLTDMIELADRTDLDLLTKVTFAFDPSILMSPMALPRDLLDELIDKTLDYIGPTDLPSLRDTLVNMKTRPTFAEQWSDEYAAAAIRGKRRLMHLDKIRGGVNMEYILHTHPRVQDWWNSIEA